MLRISYISILFIFLSFSSNAKIDEKGLICKCIKNTKVGCLEDRPYQGITPFIGIYFNDDKVYVNYLTRIYIKGKSKLSIVKDIGTLYYEDPRYIQWPRPGGVTQQYNLEHFFDKGITRLDRKKLILTNEYKWGDFGSNNPTAIKTDLIKYDCNSTDIYKNPINGIEAFEIEMDKFRKKGQKIENEIKRENKI